MDSARKTQGDKLAWARQQHERSIVLKQMCANNVFAIVLAALLIPIDHYLKSPLFLLIIGIPLVVSLYWGYHVTERNLHEFEKEIIHPTNDTNTKES